MHIIKSGQTWIKPRHLYGLLLQYFYDILEAWNEWMDKNEDNIKNTFICVQNIINAVWVLEQHEGELNIFMIK